MTQNRKCIAAIALLLTAVAAGCGGAGLEDEDLGGCVEVADEDGVYVECPDSAADEENWDEDGAGESEEAFLANCSGAAPSAVRCVPIMLTK